MKGLNKSLELETLESRCLLVVGEGVLYIVGHSLFSLVCFVIGFGSKFLKSGNASQNTTW